MLGTPDANRALVSAYLEDLSRKRLKLLLHMTGNIVFAPKYRQCPLKEGMPSLGEVYVKGNPHSVRTK